MWFTVHTEKADPGAEQDLRLFVDNFASPVFKLLLLEEENDTLKLFKEAGQGRECRNQI